MTKKTPTPSEDRTTVTMSDAPVAVGDEWNHTLHQAEFNARAAAEWLGYLLHTSLPTEVLRARLERIRSLAEDLADAIYTDLRTDRWETMTEPQRLAEEMRQASDRASLAWVRVENAPPSRRARLQARAEVLTQEADAAIARYTAARDQYFAARGWGTRDPETEEA